jgi:hypothetical protein
LLIVDLNAPGPRDPNGIHAAIWEELTGDEYRLPQSTPLTLSSYEAASTLRAYVVHLAIGDPIADMPLFLEPQQTVTIPLEATYQQAFAALPSRWRRVLDATPHERTAEK